MGSLAVADNLVVGDGRRLFMLMPDLEFRIFPSNPQPMIQNCNFVATFWSVFNIMKLKTSPTSSQPTTGKHGFVCVFHYSPNCFIIPRTHSFGFLIRDQFHPIGKQFSDKLQSAVSRLPVSAQPAAMSQTGNINLITCARLHLPSWASVMLGFDSF